MSFKPGATPPCDSCCTRLDSNPSILRSLGVSAGRGRAFARGFLCVMISAKMTMMMVGVQSIFFQVGIISINSTNRLAGATGEGWLEGQRDLEFGSDAAVCNWNPVWAARIFQLELFHRPK
uniref:(northern house mosquito) hypothetical protein n=1 Tax=Culex pipiens TaxID=7175 RepID=A0A8D8D6Z9_CULPI